MSSLVVSAVGRAGNINYSTLGGADLPHCSPFIHCSTFKSLPMILPGATTLVFLSLLNDSLHWINPLKSTICQGLPGDSYIHFTNFFSHYKQPDPAGWTPSTSKATWVDSVGFVCPNLLKIPRKHLLCEVGLIHRFSSPSLYIINIPLSQTPMSQKRLNPKESYQDCTCPLYTYLWLSPCLFRPTPDPFHACHSALFLVGAIFCL